MVTVSLLTQAQQKTVSGKVTDETGQAVPGVKVIVIGRNGRVGANGR